jgi:hypothetical protein
MNELQVLVPDPPRQRQTIPTAEFVSKLPVAFSLSTYLGIEISGSEINRGCFAGARRLADLREYFFILGV